MSFQVSLDFSDQLLIKSGGAGAGEGQICLPRPSATALLSGLRQKGNNLKRQKARAMAIVTLVWHVGHPIDGVDPNERRSKCCLLDGLPGG
jgi:hypothetical protein